MPWAIIITRIVGIVHCDLLYKSPEAPCFVAELNIGENESHIFLNKTQPWTNCWSTCMDVLIVRSRPPIQMKRKCVPCLPPWSVVLHMFINALK